MPVKLSPPPRQQFEDANGNPYAAAKLFTYSAGSTTKLPTFTDSAGGTANTNPIILDSAGRTPFGLWLTEGKTYKLVLAPSTDTDPPTSPIFTEDNVSGINDTTTSGGQWAASGTTPTYIGVTQFSVVGDKTADFHVGRRVKFTVTAGTVYGRISVTAYTTLTTVTIVGGALDSGLSAVELSALTAVNHTIPALVAADLQGIGIQPHDDQLTTLAGITVQGATNLTTLSAITATQATDLASVSTFMGTVLNDASQAVALTTLGAPLNAIVALTAAYTVVAADRGKLFDCSGTFTVTLTAAATLGAGFSFAVRNSGTGVITLDPDAAELVDGVATIAYAAGVSSLVTCNGTAFKTVGLTVATVFSKSYTSPDLVQSVAGSFTLAHGLGVLPRAYSLRVKCVVAELAYAVGELIWLDGLKSDGAAHGTCMSIIPTATNIFIRLGDSGNVLLQHKTTGAGTWPTAANFVYILEAFA